MLRDEPHVKAIAVCDPLPLVSFGLELVLGDMVCSVEPTDLPEWASHKSAEVAVLSLVNETLWRVAKSMVAITTVRVVALLDEVSRPSVTDAIKAGASSVCGRHGSPNEIAAIVACARAGSNVIPATVLSHNLNGVSVSNWTREERHWLRALSKGISIPDLAWDSGLSQRTMARRLREIYQRLDADRLPQALANAGRLGLLE